MFVQTFKILGLIASEKSLTQSRLDGKRKQMEKDGKINHSILLFFYTIEFNCLYML